MRRKLAACKGESVTVKVEIFGGNQTKNWRVCNKRYVICKKRTLRQQLCN